METFSELVEFVEDSLGGEAINPGRRKEVVLVVHSDDFDEELVYDALPNWNGSFSPSENLEDYEELENSLIIHSGLCVDLDGESLVPFENEDDYLNEDEEDDDDAYSDEESNSNGWLGDEEV